jgi:hypothetical protein
MKVGDRVQVFGHAKRGYLGKTGVITGSGGVAWGRSRTMNGTKGKQLWRIRMDGTEETILCIEKGLKTYVEYH